MTLSRKAQVLRKKNKLKKKAAEQLCALNLPVSDWKEVKTSLVQAKMKRPRSQSPSRRFFEKLRGGPLTFGKMIESLRLSGDTNQVELAKKMGMSKSHLCDIEKERRSVSLQVAARFAKVMGYDVNHFVSVALEDQLHEAGLKLRVSLKAA